MTIRRACGPRDDVSGLGHHCRRRGGRILDGALVRQPENGMLTPAVTSSILRPPIGHIMG